MLSATNEAILNSSNADDMLQKATAAAVDGEEFIGAAIFLKASDSALLRMEACAGEFADLIGRCIYQPIPLSRTDRDPEELHFGPTNFASATTSLEIRRVDHGGILPKRQA